MSVLLYRFLLRCIFLARSTLPFAGNAPLLVFGVEPSDQIGLFAQTLRYRKRQKAKGYEQIVRLSSLIRPDS